MTHSYTEGFSNQQLVIMTALVVASIITTTLSIASILTTFTQ